MTQIRFYTAGESHGKALVGIIEGMPSNLKIDREKINNELKRRQLGYGRGDRMKIESDEIEILSGIRSGHTTGSPISLMIENKDWPNWEKRLSIWDPPESQPLTVPRPGHADFAGYIKYEQQDIRNILERASARETAMRVAIGALMKQLLDTFKIWIGSHVFQIHSACSTETFRNLSENSGKQTENEIKDIAYRAEKSEVRCADPETERKMKDAIDQAKANGDSVGGLFECAALNVPVGLGSHVAWDRRLDGKIASSMMSIPAIKSVEIGLGIENADRLGSEVHDPFQPDGSQKIRRLTNRAGGVEGGISNGQPIIIRAAMKPIPTLTKPLPSIDLKTGKPVMAHKERSDVCAVPAASIVGEAMLAITLGTALCDTFGSDSIGQIKRQLKSNG